MLTGVLGIRVLLWMGENLPRPAPVEAMRALQEVEVHFNDRAPSGFRLVFALHKDKSLDYTLLKSGALEPGSLVVVAAIMGVVPHALINGVITHHQIEPSAEAGGSRLTVMGQDVGQMMDLEERNEPYDNRPDFLIFNQVIASRYARYGVVPLATPTTDFPLMLYRTPWQQGTDRAFLQELARRNGFVFYLEPTAPGVTTAYFGPENRLGIPQPTLSFNLGSLSNVQSLHVGNDALAPVASRGVFVEPFTRTSIPIPALPSLRLPPLSAEPAPALRTALTRDSANRNPAQAALAGLSQSMSAPEPVEVRGSLDTVRYGHVLRNRRLVGLRGVGLSYDGYYYVRQVTHRIDVRQSSYTQSFGLSREGIGTLLPLLPPL